MSNVNTGPRKGVGRGLFFVLFGIVILALIALAIAQFVDGPGTHTAASTTPAGSTAPVELVAPTGTQGSPGPTGTSDGASQQGIAAAAIPASRTFYAGTYHVRKSTFEKSFVQVPTSNVSGNSSTISSQYLVGTAPIYDAANHRVGTYSATFVTLQNANGISTDSTSYFSAGAGLVATWSTPKKVKNLTLTAITGSVASKGTLISIATKVASSKYFGDSFDLVITSSGGNLYFAFDRAN